MSLRSVVSHALGREEISGQRLWEGSLLLCAHLLEACGGSNRDGEQEQPELDLNGKAVLELGAGTGVVSMLAHGLGAVPVVVTDGDKRYHFQWYIQIAVMTAEPIRNVSSRERLSQCLPLSYDLTIRSYIVVKSCLP